MLCLLTKPMVRRNIFTKEKPGVEYSLSFRLLSRMILRSQPVSSLIRTGLGRFEEAEYLPKRKTSFILTDFPMRYSRSLSMSDLSSRMESLSGSPKRTRLQALESEIYIPHA